MSQADIHAEYDRARTALAEGDTERYRTSVDAIAGRVGMRADDLHTAIHDAGSDPSSHQGLLADLDVRAALMGLTARTVTFPAMTDVPAANELDLAHRIDPTSISFGAPRP